AGERAAVLLPPEDALQLALRGLRQVGAVRVEEQDVDALRVAERGADVDAARAVLAPGLEPRDRQRDGLQVADVDRPGGQRAVHRALERAGRAGHVAAGDDRGALLQRRGVGAGEPHRQLRRDLHVDQPGHAARAEEVALPARLPDHAGVDDRAGLDRLERVDLHAAGDVRLRLDHALVADDRALL